MVGDGVGDGGAEGFPTGFKHFSSWIDHFDTIIVFRVVGSGDHKTDAFAFEFFGAESTDEADAEAGGIKHVGASTETGGAVGEGLVDGFRVRLGSGGDELDGQAFTEVGACGGEGGWESHCCVEAAKMAVGGGEGNVALISMENRCVCCSRLGLFFFLLSMKRTPVLYLCVRL